jgi:antitoxin FitA
MKNVQVRNLPARTHAVLRKRAAEAGMSMQEYLLAALNEIADRPTVAEVLTRAGGRAGGRVGLATAAKELRTDRSRR